MAGNSVTGGGRPPLFATEKPARMAAYAYRLFASTIFAGVLLIWLYRATHVPPRSSSARRWAWLWLSAAELWFGFYWLLTLSVRWSPVYRRAFPDRLSQSYKEEQLPGVDIFVCTADPTLEPPMLVISTVLSVMAYDYPPEKLNIYLSDDAGSVVTFYALNEASEFANHWIPFCKKYKVEPRSPAAYFAKMTTPPDDTSDPDEWCTLKEMHDDLIGRVNSVVNSGKIPEVPEGIRGFSQWNEKTTSGDHPSIVQIRVSSVISNSPIIMNVDCDMYSNNSGSIRDALCFFLDKEQGQDIGFVQYPQNFENVVHNDIYGNPINTVNELDHPCLDGWGGMCYYGTGCFHRREALCGRIYSQDYEEDWTRVVRKTEDVDELEGMAKSLATCTYEYNSLWGIEKGVRYGCPLEDVITGLQIQCRGWRSVYYNPARKGFLGMAPTSLLESLKCGDTAAEWWNAQRMWLLRRISSYLLAAIDTIRRMLGISESGFALTAKVSDVQALERYKKGLMDDGVWILHHDVRDYCYSCIAQP
ncbi:hypothetical protein PR202_ga02575 [Eleusine coracana subsp. coracana]|uniref:Cellulose synthase-like protein E1 n=1 Tax=Eleusine coracana subsp. coracana TaxID=191504 RepID=A0AAV5BKG3_ELECO|nr:hypothetical protein PR202_ga02575 [Eleusine coracana subsp. coracana]